MAAAPSSDLRAFQATLRESEHIIVIASTSLSERSNILPLKDTQWHNRNAKEIASSEEFRNSPSLVWQFYQHRRELIRKAKPNGAHMAIAAFSQPGVRELRAAPGSTFSLITQCIDSLSLIANRAVENVLRAQYEPFDVFEVHGSVFSQSCPVCGHLQSDIPGSALNCDALTGTGRHRTCRKIPNRDLPRCSQCGALARPGVVWEREKTRRLTEIEGLVKQADLCLLIGPADLFEPASSYASIVKRNGKKVAIFTMKDAEDMDVEDKAADFLFSGAYEEVLPKALGLSEIQYFV